MIMIFSMDPLCKYVTYGWSKSVQQQPQQRVVNEQGAFIDSFYPLLPRVVRTRAAPTPTHARTPEVDTAECVCSRVPAMPLKGL